MPGLEEVGLDVPASTCRMQIHNSNRGFTLEQLLSNSIGQKLKVSAKNTGNKKRKSEIHDRLLIHITMSEEGSAIMQQRVTILAAASEVLAAAICSESLQ